jgi:hypothetical protein
MEQSPRAFAARARESVIVVVVPPAPFELETRFVNPRATG